MDDQALRRALDLVRRGDRDAFEELYRDLSTPVFTILLRVTRDRGLAEDLLQEFFLKVYRTPPGPAVKKPRAYLFRMAGNLALDALRAKKETEPLEDWAGPAREGDPLRRLALEEAFDGLSPAERQTAALHLNGGLTFREIAEATGTPLGTVLWRYRSAIGKLREALSGGIV